MRSPGTSLRLNALAMPHLTVHVASAAGFLTGSLVFAPRGKVLSQKLFLCHIFCESFAISTLILRSIDGLKDLCESARSLPPSSLIPAWILSHLPFLSGRVFLPDAHLFFASSHLRPVSSPQLGVPVVTSKSASLILILHIPGNFASCFSANFPQTCFHQVRPQLRNILCSLWITTHLPFFSTALSRPSTI